MTWAISWIPRGRGLSKSKRVVAVPDPPPPSKRKKDTQEFISLHSSHTENEDMVGAIAGDEVANDPTCDNITLTLKDPPMERYDDEDQAGVELFSSGTGDLHYASNHMYPYIIDKNDDDELKDMDIYPTNYAAVVSARKDLLEFRVFPDNVTYAPVRRLIEVPSVPLRLIDVPSVPLCTAWLGCPLQGGERGNFLAVGMIVPLIEIWDLDVMEKKPCVVLGGTDGHTDSVLGLAWNKEYRNILASASADTRVKIWDIVAGKCFITMEHHSDKVIAVAWNHHSPHVLLSGSSDHTVIMKDRRMPSHCGYKWSVTADVMSLAWDPHNEHSFVVSLEDGIVKCFDIRTATSDTTSESTSAFTLHAHKVAVTSVSYNLLAPNLLATGSLDRRVKLWDLSNNKPSCVASRDLGIGGIRSISFSEDNPFALAIGGSRGEFTVWNTLHERVISRRYENYKE